MHNGQLVFNERFRERSEKDQLAYLEKLCSSQNHALDLMQKERNALAEENKILKSGLENAQTALDSQKDIVRNLINQTNSETQGTADRIHELETTVRAQDKTIRTLNGDHD